MWKKIFGVGVMIGGLAAGAAVAAGPGFDGGIENPLRFGEPAAAAGWERIGEGAWIQEVAPGHVRYRATGPEGLAALRPLFEARLERLVDLYLAHGDAELVRALDYHRTRMERLDRIVAGLETAPAAAAPPPSECTLTADATAGPVGCSNQGRAEAVYKVVNTTQCHGNCDAWTFTHVTRTSCSGLQTVDYEICSESGNEATGGVTCTSSSSLALNDSEVCSSFSEAEVQCASGALVGEWKDNPSCGCYAC